MRIGAGAACERRGWAGIDLNPLPHESSLSAALRFAGRNAITARQVMANWSHLRSTTRCLLDTDIFESELVQNCCGWEVPTESDIALYGLLGCFTERLCASGLKVCPECWKAWYHSTWFQFDLVDRCPVHGCILQTTCPSCGKSLGAYGIDANIFKRPFMCAACAECHQNAPDDIRPHLALRSQSERLTAAFQPIAQWVAGASHRLHFIRAFFKARRNWESWDIRAIWALIDYLAPIGSWAAKVPKAPVRVDLWGRTASNSKDGFQRGKTGYWCALAAIARRYPDAHAYWLREWAPFHLALELDRLGFRKMTATQREQVPIWRARIDNGSFPSFATAAYWAFRASFDQWLQPYSRLPRLNEYTKLDSLAEMPLSTVRSQYVSLFEQLRANIAADNGADPIDIVHRLCQQSVRPVEIAVGKEVVGLQLCVNPGSGAVQVCRFMQSLSAWRREQTPDNREFLIELGNALFKDGHEISD